MQVEAATARKTKAGGRIKAVWTIAVYAESRQAERRNSFQRNAKSRTGSKGINRGIGPKVRAGFDDAANVLVQPVGTGNGESCRNATQANPRQSFVRTQICVAGKDIYLRRLHLIECIVILR